MMFWLKRVFWDDIIKNSLKGVKFSIFQQIYQGYLKKSGGPYTIRKEKD